MKPSSQEQSVWNIEITHDEIIALSRVIAYYVENVPEKLKGLTLTLGERKDLLTTLYYIDAFVEKLPILEEE